MCGGNGGRSASPRASSAAAATCVTDRTIITTKAAARAACAMAAPRSRSARRPQRSTGFQPVPVFFGKRARVENPCYESERGVASIPVHALVTVHRLVQPVDLLAGDDLRAILFVARLEADDRA